MSVGVCFNFPVGFAMDRQYQSATDGGHNFYNAEESTRSTLWDLDSSALIVPPLVPVYFNPDIRPQFPSGDTMRREISEESGYQTAFDEGSSSWASDWPTNDDQIDSYNQQSWSCPSADFPAQDSQPTSDEMCWFQQQQSLSTWAGFPEVFSTATSSIPNQTENYTNTSTISYSMAGRNESTSSDESTLNDVCVPSGN